MTGTDVEVHEGLPGLARLQRAPIADSIDARTLELIGKTVAQRCSGAEIGMFLELAAHYDLDPFAKECWCAKGKGDDGKLLIMVGRDGLRKIAMRNGLRIDGDVVREHDAFRVVRKADRSREITHEYGYEIGPTDAAHPAQGGNAVVKQHVHVDARGAIVGAWAEVWVDGSGEQRGFFYAPLGEYKPTNEAKLKYSPWASQESVMILSAAERQALRQATPLSGLLAEGEVDRIADFDGTAVELPPEPAPEPAAIPVEECVRLVALMAEAGWGSDEQRMMLVAAGVEDVSDVDVAVAGLSWPQATGLSEEASAVIDARVREAQDHPAAVVGEEVSS